MAAPRQQQIQPVAAEIIRTSIPNEQKPARGVDVVDIDSETNI